MFYSLVLYKYLVWNFNIKDFPLKSGVSLINRRLQIEGGTLAAGLFESKFPSPHLDEDMSGSHRNITKYDRVKTTMQQESRKTGKRRKTNSDAPVEIYTDDNFCFAV